MYRIYKLLKGFVKTQSQKDEQFELNTLSSGTIDGVTLYCLFRVQQKIKRERNNDAS